MTERWTGKTELRLEGRKLTGTVMRYGDVSPTHRERFEPGSLRMAAAVPLNLFHDAERAIAWMPGGGLDLVDGEAALELAAELPPIPAADRALAEIRAGRATGLSVEFHAMKERRDGEVRVIESAELRGVGLVGKPSYEQSRVEARARKGAVANPWIKAQWQARKAGACECQGPGCNTVSFEPGAFTEALVSDREMLALAGSGRPLASRSKGTLAIRETEGGDIEVEVDRLAAGTDIGRDLAGQAKATRVVARPWVDVADSEFTEDGTHRIFTKVALKGVIVKATVADDGWNEVELEGDDKPTKRSLEQRRMPRWL